MKSKQSASNAKKRAKKASRNKKTSIKTNSTKEGPEASSQVKPKKSGTKAKTKTGAKTKAKAKAKTGAKTKAKVGTKTKTKAKAKAKTRIKTKAVAKVSAKTKNEAKTKAKAKTKTGTKAKAKTRASTKTKTKTSVHTLIGSKINDEFSDFKKLCEESAIFIGKMNHEAKLYSVLEPPVPKGKNQEWECIKSLAAHPINREWASAAGRVNKLITDAGRLVEALQKKAVRITYIRHLLINGVEGAPARAELSRAEPTILSTQRIASNDAERTAAGRANEFFEMVDRLFYALCQEIDRVHNELEGVIDREKARVRFFFRVERHRLGLTRRSRKKNFNKSAG